MRLYHHLPIRRIASERKAPRVAMSRIFSSDGKKTAETETGDGKRRGRNPGKDMRQSVSVLFASAYYTVENLCVRREKLFDKRHKQYLPVKYVLAAEFMWQSSKGIWRYILDL